MTSFNKINAFIEYLAEGLIDLEGDALKIVLSNDAPNASDEVLADITEIAAGNGYEAGGAEASIVSSGQTDGAYRLVLSNVTISASGGAIGPFRYFILVDDTPSSPADPLIGWWDYGAPLTLADGESITIQFSAGDGALQIA